MKDEVTAGLKNAIERGESIERATQSFINAGYNPVEVKQAADSLTRGGISITNATKFNLPKPKENPEPPTSNPQIAQPPTTPQKKKTSKKTWILILIVTLLFITLGTLAAIFFWEDILYYLTG